MATKGLGFFLFIALATTSLVATGCGHSADTNASQVKADRDVGPIINFKGLPGHYLRSPIGGLPLNEIVEVTFNDGQLDADQITMKGSFEATLSQQGNKVRSTKGEYVAIPQNPMMGYAAIIFGSPSLAEATETNGYIVDNAQHFPADTLVTLSLRKILVTGPGFPFMVVRAPK